jgi:hypothetical protein
LHSLQMQRLAKRHSSGRLLQAGRTQVAAHIYEEVNFGTSNVTP